MYDSPSSGRGRAIGVVVVIALLGVALTAFAMSNRSTDQMSKGSPSPTPLGAATSTPPATTTPVTPDGATEAQPTPASASTYVDGSYSATGRYQSPGGSQKLNVTLTIKNDVVVTTTASSGAIDNTSASYQQKFLSGYQAQVVGRSLATLRLDRVSGSSLTPKGFNDAVTQIKVQADRS